MGEERRGWERRGRERRERRGEMVEWEGAEHQKHAILGMLLVFEGMEGAEHQKHAILGMLLVFEGMEGAEHQKCAVLGAFVVFKERGRGREGGVNIRHIGHVHMGMFYMS